MHNYNEFNVDRTRYYGLLEGDIVKSDIYRISKAKVYAYCFMDNNSVFIKEHGLKPRKVVAEWIEIITKVEDLQ